MTRGTDLGRALTRRSQQGKSWQGCHCPALHTQWRKSCATAEKSHSQVQHTLTCTHSGEKPQAVHNVGSAHTRTDTQWRKATAKFCTRTHSGEKYHIVKKRAELVCTVQQSKHTSGEKHSVCKRACKHNKLSQFAENSINCLFCEYEQTTQNQL